MNIATGGSDEGLVLLGSMLGTEGKILIDGANFSLSKQLRQISAVERQEVGGSVEAAGQARRPPRKAGRAGPRGRQRDGAGRRGRQQDRASRRGRQQDGAARRSAPATARPRVASAAPAARRV